MQFEIIYPPRDFYWNLLPFQTERAKSAVLMDFYELK